MTTPLRTSHLYDDPGALIAATPGLLGFHPDDSVILITYTGARQLDLESVMRMDLPPADHITDVAHQLCIVAMNHEAVMVDLIVLGGPGADPPHRLPSRALITEVSALLEAHNIALAHAVWAPHATHGRMWWCYTDPGCTGHIHNPATSPLAAAMTTPGTLTRRNRADLAALLTPDPTHLLAPRAALIESLPPNPNVETEYTYLRSTIDTLPNPHTPNPNSRPTPNPETDQDPESRSALNDDPDSRPGPGADTQANSEPSSAHDPEFHLAPDSHPAPTHDPRHPWFHPNPATESVVDLDSLPPSTPESDPKPASHPTHAHGFHHPWFNSNPARQSHVDPATSTHAPTHDQDSRHPWFQPGSHAESQVDLNTPSIHDSQPHPDPEFRSGGGAKSPLESEFSFGSGVSDQDPESPFGYGPEPDLDDPTIARLARAVSISDVREACLAFALTHRAARAERLWATLTRVTPAPFRANPACLLAVSTYLRGEGTLASIALDLAEAADPHHHLTRTLREVIDFGLPPRRFRLMLAESLVASLTDTDTDNPPDPEPPNTPAPNTPAATPPPQAATSDAPTTPDALTPDAPTSPDAPIPDPLAHSAPDRIAPSVPDRTSAHTNHPGPEPGSPPSSRHLNLAHPNPVHGHTKPKHATGPQHLAPQPDSPPAPLPEPPPVPWPEPPPTPRHTDPKHATTDPESGFSQWEAALARRRAGPEYQARHRAA